MSMHLLPAYWTTNNHKKRKKKVISKKRTTLNIRTREVSQKMGVDPNYKMERPPLKLSESL